jgi:hypothetical protein
MDVKLVLLDEVIEKVMRIDRILTKKKGNLMMIGV